MFFISEHNFNMAVAKEVDRLMSEFYKRKEMQEEINELREYVNSVKRDVHQLSNELQEVSHNQLSNKLQEALHKACGC